VTGSGSWPGPADAAQARGPQGEPDVFVRATPEEVSALAAERIVDALGTAIDERGRADFATTGGSTPIGIYDILSSTLRSRIDWSLVQFWWGDDRFVPRDHPLSNVQAADAILFAISQYAGQSGNLLDGIDVQEGLEPGLVVPVANIHPFPCGPAIAHSRPASWCAQEYAAELQAAGLREQRGFPVFDVVLLGLGPDGHLMSVFPHSEALGRSEWAMAIPAPTHVEPHVERVTLNPAILDVARTVLMVTSGAAKAPVVGQIFGDGRDPRLLPAQLVRRAGATWILDTSAATELPEGLVRG
jgi:6-phosphogluconolactonase